MDTIPTEDHNPNQQILKSNLWKFFKTLRVQANPIYSLLAGSPIEYACISIVDKKEPSQQLYVSINDFVSTLKDMPSKDKYYHIRINLYYLESQNECTYNATSRNDLSVELIKLLYPRIVAYHCVEASKHGSCFTLTPQIIKHFRIKRRYITELQKIIEQCNNKIINL